MKPIIFLGDSLNRLRDFPDDVRQAAGYQLHIIQNGQHPDDFKPMPTVGQGVEELRIWDETGTYRIIYLARLSNAVYVLHALNKKSQTTPKHDIELASKRYNDLMRAIK